MQDELIRALNPAIDHVWELTGATPQTNETGTICFHLVVRLEIIYEIEQGFGICRRIGVLAASMA